MAEHNLWAKHERARARPPLSQEPAWTATPVAALLRAVSAEQVARVVLVDGVQALGATFGLLHRRSAEGEALSLIGSVGVEEPLPRPLAAPALEADLPFTEVVRTGQPLWLGSREALLARFPGLAAAEALLATEGWLCFPVEAGEHRQGAITFGLRTGRSLGRAERAYVGALVEQCALALERARLYEAEKHARLASERLQSLSAALSAAATRAEVGEVLMREGVAALGAYAGVLALETRDGRQLEIMDSIGYPPEACMSAGRCWPANARIPIAEATRSGEPVFLGSPEAWALHFGTPMRSSGRSAAWAALPVRLRSRTRGALLWTFDEPQSFGEAERQLMESIARLGSQALERAALYAEVEEANRAKADFLATMSHELRTPLTAVIGYQELLAEEIPGPINPAQRSQLQRIKTSATHLLALIDEILTFARVESGAERARPEPLDVEEVLRAAAEIVAPLAAERGLLLVVNPPARAVEIRTDRGKLRQMLVNLLSNAVKFTEQGRVELCARAEGDAVLLEVSDTGIGIAEADQERIFEPFTQVESATTRRFEGTGLGLSVCRRLGRLLGGEVTVRSAPGAGSTFTVRLPLEAPTG